MEVKNKCLSPVAVPRITGTTLPIFRCGKCPNCLKQKANELSVRAIREVGYRPLGWVTLTYDDANCPIQVSEDSVDMDTGEIVHVRDSIVRDSSFFQRASFVWRKKWIKGQKRPVLVKRYLPQTFHDDA